VTGNNLPFLIESVNVAFFVVLIHADGSRRDRVFTFFILFRTISQKNDAARITKLDTKMFHREFLKFINFGVKIVNVTSQ